jgi:hypothetical protein
VANRNAVHPIAPTDGCLADLELPGHTEQLLALLPDRVPGR